MHIESGGDDADDELCILFVAPANRKIQQMHETNDVTKCQAIIAVLTVCCSRDKSASQ